MAGWGVGWWWSRHELSTRREAAQGAALAHCLLRPAAAAVLAAAATAAGVKVTDLAGLQRVPAAPADVAKLISQTFNEMVG